VNSQPQRIEDERSVNVGRKNGAVMVRRDTVHALGALES
jgi:hypothetical protein